MSCMFGERQLRLHAAKWRACTLQENVRGSGSRKVGLEGKTALLAGCGASGLQCRHCLHMWAEERGWFRMERDTMRWWRFGCLAASAPVAQLLRP